MFCIRNHGHIDGASHHTVTSLIVILFSSIFVISPLCKIIKYHQRYLLMLTVPGKDFKCTFPGCEFETIRKSRLEDHMDAHRGVKNHMCSICGKAFAGRKHMQVISLTSQLSCGHIDANTETLTETKFSSEGS